MKGRSITYDQDELDWIEARCRMPRREMHALFCARFERDDVSLSNLNALCKRRGWMTGRTGRYEPDREPENKGKSMPFHPNSAATRFKKGNRPHNSRGPGHERIDGKDGYVVMIIEEPNPWSGAATRPVHKHRYLWEKANGPVPEGHALKCLDGDKTNTDPSNWEPVPRGMLPRLNGRWNGLKFDDAPAEVKPTLMAIARLDNQAREARRRKK
ncbi:HNH endonuclease [Paracoccus sp. R12_1]|uniref:HNH endonuclease signature motif containing protein n=1 Tax=unclassified Paracoccus (in: a-proteobacteria) TaxID=2688777 RepID=UPI001ADBF31D|nr:MULTISPECIES: HNH endonuclease signature motif containing protein [unclassified Paracoccus (in: a-proteobacteria)]MBO9456836.1 HNH endonuclease [Paracoccus sp. R12_2]MBO9487931.1 HNH endonuclease [Paracoccus sp. R12_1]